MFVAVIAASIPVAIFTPIFAPIVTKALGIPCDPDIQALMPRDRDTPFFERLPKQ